MWCVVFCLRRDIVDLHVIQKDLVVMVQDQGNITDNIGRTLSLSLPLFLSVLPSLTHTHIIHILFSLCYAHTQRHK